MLTVPHDENLEKLALGCMIDSEAALLHGLAELSESSFLGNNKVIFISLKDLHSKGAPTNDCFILAKEAMKNDTILGEKSLNEVMASLAEMANAAYGADYKYYFNEIKNIALKREGMKKAIKLSEQFCDKEVDAHVMIHTASQAFIDLISDDVTDKSLEEYSQLWHEKKKMIEERIKKGLPTYIGLPTGYSILDRILGGLQAGKLYYCGARTFVGKTTFIANITANMLQNTKAIIGFMSLEMSGLDIYERITSICADVSNTRFFNKDLSSWEESQVFKAEAFMQSCKDRLTIFDPPTISIEKLCTKAKILKNKGLDVLFIDYLTRIESEKKHANMHLEVSYISKQLQNLARELNIPIFCLAQLNREAAKEEDKRPKLSDFRESGSIEQDADACLMLYRPGMKKAAEDTLGITEVIVMKNRINSETGSLDLKCNLRISHKLRQTINAGSNKVYEIDTNGSNFEYNEEKNN